MSMDRYFFLIGHGCERVDRQTLIQPVFQGFNFHDSKLTTEDTEENNLDIHIGRIETRFDDRSKTDVFSL